MQYLLNQHAVHLTWTSFAVAGVGARGELALMQRLDARADNRGSFDVRNLYYFVHEIVGGGHLDCLAWWMNEAVTRAWLREENASRVVTIVLQEARSRPLRHVKRWLAAFIQAREWTSLYLYS